MSTPASPSSDASPLLRVSNRRIALFLGKILAFYAIWYVLYDLWLLPDGSLDRWLSLNVASVAGTLIEGLGFEPLVDGRVISLANTRGISIANGCNGLSTLGLFVGFVLAYPGSNRRRLWFLPLGIAVVYVTNVARVIAMLFAQKYWPAAFDPLHGFGLTTIFYVVVFGLWVAWANYGQPSSPPGNDSDPSSDASTPSPAVSPS